MTAYRPQGEYVPDRRGWASFANSQTLADACEAVAFRGALFAISISPERTGDYRKSWRVERGLFISQRYGPRVAMRLVNDSRHAAAVEFTNKRSHTASAVVQRTAAFLGGGSMPAPKANRPDPAGSKRDKNGRLRDARGRFI